MNKKLLFSLLVIGIIVISAGIYKVKRHGELEGKSAPLPTPISTPVLSPTSSIELQGNWTADDYIENRIPPVLSEQYLKPENINETTLGMLDITLSEAKISLHNQRGKITNPEAKNLLNRVMNEIDQTKEDVSSIKKRGEITQQDKEIIISHLKKIRGYLMQGFRMQYESRMKDEWKYDEFIEKYKPEEYHPMKFGAILQSASYQDIYYKDLEYILKDLKTLEDTGADIIRIDIDSDHWIFDTPKNREAIDKYDKIINQIKADNKKLMIAINGVQYYWTHPVSWDKWKKDHLWITEKLVRKYHPDYIIIVKEPNYYRHFQPSEFSDQINEPVSPDQWVEQSIESAKLAKKLSKDIKVGVAIVTWIPESQDYFKKIMKEGTNIDFVGYDPYGFDDIKAIEDTLPYWNKEKELWILEIWDGSQPVYHSHLSDKFIKGSVYYAQTMGLNGYVIFYCHNLHTNDFKIIKGSDKTPAFYAYKNVIEEVRNNTR